MTFRAVQALTKTQCTTGTNDTIVAHYDLLPEGSIAYRISGHNLIVRNRYAGLSIGKLGLSWWTSLNLTLVRIPCYPDHHAAHSTIRSLVLEVKRQKKG